MSLASSLLKAGTAAAGAAAISFITPEEAQGAISMRSAAPLAEEALEKLNKWAADKDTMQLLKGSDYKGKIIASVYKPAKGATAVEKIMEQVEALKAKQAKYNEYHSSYKDIQKKIDDLTKSTKDDAFPEKRVITFEDQSYINVDKDDLKTIITHKGLANYMRGAVDEEGKTVIKGYQKSTDAQKARMAARSLHYRNYFKDSYTSLEAAREFRKKNAKHQMDLFGEMLTGVQTIEYDGKFFNIPLPYIQYLKDFKKRSISDLPALVKQHKGKVPKEVIETLRQAQTLKFLSDKEITYIPSVGYKSKREWSTPKGWEEL